MKLGLVLEGGASRTYFTSGVLDALMEENIWADYVIGVSAGIANQMFYTSKQKGRNIKVGLKYLNDRRYMGLEHLLFSKDHCYFNLPFVFGQIPNELEKFDNKTLGEYPGEILAGVTNIETGQPEYLKVTNTDENWKVLQASCALPILFSPIEVNGSLYMDGGLSDAIPFAKAIQEGCDKNIVVLTRERGYIREKNSKFDIILYLYRKFPKFVEVLKNRVENYNNCLQRLEEEERAGNVFVIAPDYIKDIKRTEKDLNKIKAIYEQGYQVAQRNMPELVAYLER